MMKIDDEILKEAGAFRFSLRPSAIPVANRLLWRLSHLVIALACGGRAQSASISKLLFLTWLLREKNEWAEVSSGLLSGHRPLGVFVRQDPLFVHTVNFAVGEGIVATKNGNVLVLTEKGQSYFKRIESVQLFQDEREFLAIHKSKFTEAKIKEFLG